MLNPDQAKILKQEMKRIKKIAKNLILHVRTQTKNIHMVLYTNLNSKLYTVL